MDSVLSLTSSITGPILLPACRSAVISLFTKLKVGRLDLIEPDGNHLTFGDFSLAPLSTLDSFKDDPTSTTINTTQDQDQDASSTSPPVALLLLKSTNFYIRLTLGKDLGFSESYMSSEVSTPNLANVFSLFIANRSSLSELDTGIAGKIGTRIQSLLNRRYANTKVGSLKNIGAHYDISNTMYEAFLSADMTYSCAIFPTLDSDLTNSSMLANASFAASAKLAANGINGSSNGSNGLTNGVGGLSSPNGISDSSSPSRDSTLHPDDELEAGQRTKLRAHIQRANIQRGDRVLEIGTGWGSFAIEAVKTTGCKVDSLTLSKEQKALAEERIKSFGLEDSIKVHLMDYRDMPLAWKNKFDRIVSIEMLEAVGLEFLSTYFSCLNQVLKREGGTITIQCITIPEDRFDSYSKEVDFIRKWIFPGGVLPSVTSIYEAVKQGSNGELIPEGLINIGPHYSRTLREWRNRFELNFENIIRPALMKDHKEISELADAEKEREVEVFRRKWRYYFVYCEVGFTERVIGDHILSFTRQGNKSLPAYCA